MAEALDYYKAELFWEWFEENEENIKEVYENDDSPLRDEVIKSLNNQVLQFGLFTWEIGLGNSKQYSFTISPNGDPELLAISKPLIKQAPPLSDWEFHYARPAKDWDLNFKLYDEDYFEQEVDASRWKFVKIPAAGGKAKLIVEAANAAHLDAETKQTAANLVVSSLMGEERKITEVSTVEVVLQLSAAHKAAAVSIFKLLQ